MTEPFTDDSAMTVSSLGELGLLREIREWLGPATLPPPHGMGDDCAVLESSAKTFNLVTVDSLIYGRHVDERATAKQAGAKLLKRNLSDIAAMGGAPASAVLALFLPPNLKIEWLREFYEGIRHTAEEWDVRIVGGDLCETAGIPGGSLTLWGYAERPVTREGAKAGDILFVSGPLGGSLLGKHLDFEPRLREGRWLASQPDVHSMIDVTDGLLTDLKKMIPPGNHALLNTGQLPISEAAHAAAKESGRTPLDHALKDGEDYELVFTVSRDLGVDEFEKSWQEQFGSPVFPIGEIQKSSGPSGPGTIIDQATGQPLPDEKGYEHFS